MLCRKPYAIKGGVFGCGQCMHCRFNRRRIWTHRMMLEAAVHPAASFVTLTYNKEHIPDDGSLRPLDLQLWLKRFRKRVGACRYFAVGEYGDYSWRPHYHLALFGHGRECGKEVADTWGQGFSFVGDLTLHSAQYVAGYVTKKLTSVKDERLRGRYPEFARMSLRPGIGSPAIHTIVQALQNKHGWDAISARGDVPSVLRHGRQDMPLGRYMREGIRRAIGFKFREESSDETFRKTAEMLALYKDKVADGSLSLRAWKEALDGQKALNAEVRAKIYGQRSKI